MTLRSKRAQVARGVRLHERPGRSPSRQNSSRVGTVITSTVLVLLAAVSGNRSEAADCSACHEAVSTVFAESTHGRAFHFKEGASWTCESCHGSGEAHAEAGDPSKISNPRKSDASVVNDACLSCHREQAEAANWKGSTHESAGLSCASCHAIHGATAAAPKRGGHSGAGTLSPTTEVCLACHISQRKALNQRSTHPVREGKMDCASCHNPHGSTSAKLLRGDSPNDLCYSCHQEKRSPVLWDHSPVREDCMTCHTPHGSNQEQLLVTRVNQLCQSCHLQGRHQTVAGTSNAMWNTNRACLNCHPQIHGSNHPSGVLFQR